MQNAYDSHQFTQSIGLFSLLPGEAVQVALTPPHVAMRLLSVGAILLSSDVTHPGSYPPALPLFARP